MASAGVVASRERHQGKHPGAIPKIHVRPSKPPQSPDGEKIWGQQTLNIDPVLDLEENVDGHKQEIHVVTGKSLLCVGGLSEPLYNTQQKLLKQGGDTQPTNGRETSAPKGMCGSNYSVHN